MGKFLEKLTKGFNSFKLRLGKKSKLILAGILACVMLIIFLKGLKTSSNTDSSKEPIIEASTINSSDYVANLENRLEKIVSSIDGVGGVEVFVMTETSVKTIYAGDEESKTNGENSNSITNKTVEIVFEKNGSVSTPVISLEVYPEIVGVLIVGEGLGDEKRRLLVINAIAVALNIENSKIEVLSGKLD